MQTVSTGDIAKEKTDSKNLTAHYGITMTSTFVMLLINFLSGVLLAQLLGPEGRGELAQVQVWGHFIFTLGGLGITRAINYYVSREPEKTGAYLTSAWLLLLPLSLLWFIVMYFLLPVLLAQQTFIVINMARVYLCILPIVYFVQGFSVFAARKQFVLLSVIELHRPLQQIILIIIFTLAGLNSFVLVALGYTATAIISPFLLVFLLWRSGINLQRPLITYSRQLLSFGVRSVLAMLPITLNNRVDQLFLAALVPPQSLGLYVISVSWSLILSGIFTSIGKVLFPYLAGEKDEESRQHILLQNLHWSVLLTIFISFGLITITPVMLPFFFGAEFAEAVPIAMLLIVASVFFNLKLVLADVMNGLGQPGKTAYAEIVALGLTLIGLWLTLPILGIMGAALTSLFAYLCATMLLLYFVKKHTQLSIYTLLIPTRQDFHQLFLVLRKIIQQVKTSVKRDSEEIKHE